MVEADTSPRIVELPEGLKRAFQSGKEAKAFFEKLSHTHQKEYGTWINDVKKEEARVLKTIEMLNKGKKGLQGFTPHLPVKLDSETAQDVTLAGSMPRKYS